MKPRLKPWKGWRYRIIVCDCEGRYVLDDFDNPGMASELASVLMDKLLEVGDLESRRDKNK